MNLIDRVESMEGSQLMKVWGASVVVGWIGAQILALTAALGSATPLGIITFWLVGASIPISSSLLYVRENGFEPILGIWPVAGVSGVLLNYALALGYLPFPELFVYGVFWFAAIGVGFLATAYFVGTWGKKLYGSAALLNFGVALALLQIPQLESYYFGIAALIQGAPMLADGFKHSS